LIYEITTLLCLVMSSWTTPGTESILPEKQEFKNIAILPQGVITLAPCLKDIASLDEASVWSIVQTRNRRYFGTGNNGRVYLLEPGARPKLVFDGGTGEILALCADRRGNVFFGLTPDGTIFRIRPSFPPERFFDTEQNYIFSLLPGPEGELYCATGDKGELYRISYSGRGKLVFTAPQSHITALAWLKLGKELLVGTSPDGIVYRLVFKPGRSHPDVSVLYDTQFDEIRAIAEKGTSIFLATNPAGNSGDTLTGAVLCVSSDGILQWKWNCPDSTVFDILPNASGLLVATGCNGVIYELDSLGHHSLLQKASQPRITSLASGSDGTLVGTANPARVHLLGETFAKEGHILSIPHDCKSPAQFGRVRFRADVPFGTELELDTRSGSSEKPDPSWSKWQETSIIRPVGKSGIRSSAIASPTGRFIQWRARLSTDFPNLSPKLERLDLYYRIPNRPPNIKKLEIAKPTIEEAQKGNACPIRKISWEAEDPDQDSLQFQLYFKGQSETNWKQAGHDLAGREYNLDTRTLPDGWYRFKLVASDRLSKPKESALNTQTVSLPVLVDNSPPRVINIKLRGNRLTFSVTDSSSLIASCRISVNADSWQPVEPTDGIFDACTENFRQELALPLAENIIAIWTADAQGNTATGKNLVKR